MKLTSSALRALQATQGAGSPVTQDENRKQAITFVEDEKEVLFSVLSPKDICRGKVNDCGDRAAQEFVLYEGTTDRGLIYPNLIFPKKSKNELRLYTSEEGFKPKRNSVWYIFVRRRDNRLCLGWCSVNEFDELQKGKHEKKVLSPEEADEEEGADTDYKQRVERSIKVRRGQKKFRNQLLKRFDNTCCITGSGLVDVLEAAHIDVIQGMDNNAPSNGLILRSDLHTLFDLGFIAIEPETLTIFIAPKLHTTEYFEFNRRVLILSEAGKKAINREGLRRRWDSLDWIN